MPQLVDHAAHRRRILEGAAAVPFVEAEALERRLLVGGTPDRTAGLDDSNRLLVRGLGAGGTSHYAGSFSASRRGSRSLTFLPRRDATPRGLVSSASASNVPFIMFGA